MIFEHLNTQGLEKLLTPHMDQPLWPGIKDPQVIERACQYAHQSGLWDQLSDTLRPNDPLPELRFSDYQHYLRTGSREPYQTSLNALSDAADWVALGLWLGHPSAELDHLQNVLWKWCCNIWQMPAHHGQHIELFSTRVARQLAEYAWLFEERFDRMLLDRIDKELHERILDVAHDWRRSEHWNTRENNWNIVCNSDLVQIGLYRIRSARDLAAFIHPLCRRIDYAISYFTPDGGCVEGANYWEYGVSHFLNLAIALRERTGGAVNLADDPHIRNICRYPLAVQLTREQRANFADAQNGYFSALAPLQVHHLLGDTDLFRVVESLPGQLLRMTHIRTLSLYRGQRPDLTPDPRDWHLPDLHYAKLQRGDLVLAAVAGHNGVSHNHNDIGSFILMAEGIQAVTDPGRPIYTAQTFGPRRYDMLFCNSYGHSVPVINGHPQSEGEAFCGTLDVQGLNGAGRKRISIDMTRAYPDPSLVMLRRDLDLDTNGRVTLTDTFEFDRPATSIEEAWITFEPVTIDRDGRSVRIGPTDAPVNLTTPVAGAFSVESFSPDRHQGIENQPVNRISFVPLELSRQVTLQFEFLKICHAARK